MGTSKSWTQHQGNQQIGCAIFLGIGFLVFLFWLSSVLFSFPQSAGAQRLFLQIGAPILGGLSAGLFYTLQTLIENYNLKFLRGLHLISLVITGLSIIGALVFTFLRRELSISHHWIWAPVAAPGVLLILDKATAGAQKKQAGKGGDKLSDWVEQVIKLTGG